MLSQKDTVLFRQQKITSRLQDMGPDSRHTTQIRYCKNFEVHDDASKYPKHYSKLSEEIWYEDDMMTYRHLMIFKFQTEYGQCV